MIDYKQQIAEKRQTAATQADKRQDLDELISQLKEVQLAALMNGNKSNVILADSTDLGDRVAELGDKIIRVLDEFKADTAGVEKLGALKGELKALGAAVDGLAGKQTQNVQQLAQAIAKALSAVELPAPVVTVKQPKIQMPKMDAPIIDLGPLTEILRAKETVGVDLSNYKAHDLTDGDNMQYIGFVSPTGDWYIIENDVKGNSLRYTFGRGGYTDAFGKAARLQYGLLSEAVNEIPA